MHDILVSKKSGKVNVAHQRSCFDSEYTMLCNYKYNAKQPLPDLSAYEPVQLSAEKLHQLSEQHRRYIKQNVPHNTIPSFLQRTEDVGVDSSVHTSMQQKGSRHCTYPGCNGSGHKPSNEMISVWEKLPPSSQEAS